MNGFRSRAAWCGGGAGIGAVLGALTILAVVFSLWELIEARFFGGLAQPVHFLYTSRGIAVGLLMAAWTAWLAARNRARYEKQEQELQRQIIQMEKLSALGELASGFAHEINNPVGAVLSRLELMHRAAAAGPPPETLLGDLEMIRRQTARIGETARNLLKFARRAPLRFAPVDLSEAAGNVLRLLEDLFRQGGIDVAAEWPASVPRVVGCQNHLEQVILNIVKNSVEALERTARPKIRLSMEHDGARAQVVLRIADNGPGVPTSIRSRIFDPFFTTKEGGTGLGLSVSYGIVRQHGGAISVERGASGENVFRIELPVRGPAVQEAANV